MSDSSSAKPPPGRRWLIAAAKWLVTLVAVIALFHYDGLNLTALGAVFSAVGAATGALALLVVSYALGGLRWSILLRASGAEVRLRSILEIYAIGTFFNNVLPGGTGGDVVRGVYIAKCVSGSRGGPVMSIIGDRIAGLAGLLFLALVLGVLDLRHALATPLTRTMLLLAGAMLFTIIALSLLAPRLGMAERLARLLGSWSEIRLVQIILHGIHLMAELGHDRLAIFQAFCCSFALSLLNVVAIVLLFRDFNADGLGVIDVMDAGAFALVAQVAPVTPGGLGIGEGAFALICRLWEAAPAAASYAAVFLGYRVLGVLISLIGGVAFLTYRHPPRDALSPAA
jgi:glycosyltransferase 2 family protein